MIEARQGELDSLFDRFARTPPPPTKPQSLGWAHHHGDLTTKDQAVIDRIEGSKQGAKFKKLFRGDWRGEYESQSEADLALCCILAFWCKKDLEQMDRIFRESGLDRDKWDEPRGDTTYGAITIQKAISQTESVYGEEYPSAKAASASRPKFELVQASKIEMRPTQWVVWDLIELDSLGLVFGDPGCGKSFFAIDIALAVATGTPFFGHQVKQGPVIYIAGEGHNGLKRRMMAWSQFNDISHDSAPLYISLMSAALTDIEMLSQVQAAIDLVAADHGDPVLIVIDTVARNFGPGDENSTQDMSQFIQAVDALRASTKATVLLVHHSGHSDKSRARGAMALKGALDAEYRMDRDESGVIRLEATKMKDAKYPEPMAFRLESVLLPVLDSEEKAQFSGVLTSTSYTPPPQRGKAGHGKHQTNALEILKRLHTEKRSKCATEGRDPATARISLDEWKNAMKGEGIPGKRIPEVVTALCGLKIVTESGGWVSPL